MLVFAELNTTVSNQHTLPEGSGLHFIRLISQPLGSYYLVEDKCQGCAFNPSLFCYRSGPTPSPWHDSSSLHFMFFPLLAHGSCVLPKGRHLGIYAQWWFLMDSYFCPGFCSLWLLWGHVCALSPPPLAGMMGPLGRQQGPWAECLLAHMAKWAAP